MAPVVALVLVVGVAVVGQVAAPEAVSPRALPSASAGVIVADATVLRTPLAELDPDARPTVVPFAPYPIATARPRRQKGTDGFLPGLPIDVLPEPTRRPVDGSMIDDVVPWPFSRGTRPWVRGVVGPGPTRDRVDPYKR